MIGTDVRKAAEDLHIMVKANPERWQEYDPTEFGVDARELAAQVRKYLGSHDFSVNVNASGKVVVHRL